MTQVTGETGSNFVATHQEGTSNSSQKNAADPKKSPPRLHGPHMLSVTPSMVVQQSPSTSSSDNAAVGNSSDIRASASVPVKKRPWTWRRLYNTIFRGGDGNSGETRRIVRGSAPDYNAQFDYCDNSITTSRYNIFTFLPLNLFEQFLRVANVYFLILVILQAIPVISPISPWSTAAALVFVLAVTAIKDGIDDIYRHKSDRRINNRKATVLTPDFKLKTIRWQEIRVGQIVMMKKDESIPADMLLLSSSDSSGLCFIETAELDGETNLKFRQALVQTQVLGDDAQKLGTFDGEIQCEAPNNVLTKFEGRLDYHGERLSLNNSAVLLRGCTIRNTIWTCGLVIFTGKETKLMKNAGKSVFKRTRIDRLANKFLFSIFGLLAALLIISAICGWAFESGIGRKFKDAYSLWMDVPNINPSLIAVLQLFSYLILIQTLIPISLYVTFELIRIMLSRGYINGDLEMYYEPNDTAANARTTTLNEELGQIEYIFSDKTGTLTQNIMTFNKCSIAGKMYGDARDPQTGKVVNITSRNAARYKVDFSLHESEFWEKSFQFFDKTLLDDVQNGSAEAQEFFRLIALCHTINAETNETGQLVYNAQSPDEAALVGAARNFGFVYKSRTPNSITIQVLGVETTYDVLCILDFDNVRKRMSVIVQKDGRRRLFCKGADTCLLELLKDGQNDMIDRTKAHLNEFAGSGLRTLCCAVKDIGDEEWRTWFARYQRASTTLSDRESRVFECYVDIEREMTLIGATAVEDRLQEGVPETIYNLSKAGIKVWVLTGDKQETAINIGYSCNMLNDTMEEFIVDAEDFAGVERQLTNYREQIAQIESQMNQETSFMLSTAISMMPGVIALTPSNNDSGDGVARQRRNSNPTTSNNNQQRRQTSSSRRPPLNDNHGHYALIINGHSLYHALTEQMEDLFLSVACACQAVICCRVAPLQKGSIVELVKRKKGAITLSIGDGANDVNMIKTAHIGVGISGQEGMQAVLSSDFSFGQFRFLQKLLLVHGRWAYFRVANFLRYFFYKNFAFTMCHFWFGIYCGWSAASVYDQWYITVYNIIYTSTPVINYAWIEQDVNSYYSQTYPKLYYPGPRDLFFNLFYFVLAGAEGVFASAVTYFFITYGFTEYAMPDGYTISTSYHALGVAVATTITIIVNIRISLEMSHWTPLNFFPALSIVAVFVIQIAFAEILAKMEMEFEYFGIAFAVWAAPDFWLSSLAAVVVSCLPIVFIRLIKVVFKTPLIYRVQVKQHQEKKQPEDYNQLVTRRGASFLRRSRMGSGFAFAQQSGYGSMISQGILQESGSRPGSSTGGKKVNKKRNSVGQAPPEVGEINETATTSSNNRQAANKTNKTGIKTTMSNNNNNNNNRNKTPNNNNTASTLSNGHLDVANC